MSPLILAHRYGREEGGFEIRNHAIVPIGLAGHCAPAAILPFPPTFSLPLSRFAMACAHALGLGALNASFSAQASIFHLSSFSILRSPSLSLQAYLSLLDVSDTALRIPDERHFAPPILLSACYAPKAKNISHSTRKLEKCTNS